MQREPSRRSFIFADTCSPLPIRHFVIVNWANDRGHVRVRCIHHMGMMKKTIPAESPDAYVASLSGWQRACVETLRSAVRSQRALEERVKWGHLVYLANGPVCLIRAEEQRVLFGFWRGQRLREIEPRLKPGGKYEMATVTLHEDDTVNQALARRLAKAAIDLNATLGDPTRLG